MTLDQHPLGLIAVLFALSLLPLIAMTTTSYLKISVVLILMRNALGVQQAPPTIALNAIALAVTLFVMAPTLEACLDAAREPTSTTPASGSAQLARALSVVEPLRGFMLHNTRPEERERFLDLAHRNWPTSMRASANSQDWSILVPAFVVSELQAAFEIGLLLFVPFIVIDLLVSNVLLAMGMQMVPPMMVSLPLKLLLFVVADGWGRLLHALALSYQG
ncbi:MAG TPA: type III secretion system export apparatus subunit SctR [Trinickia sp.]|jgi:type III secretion protein R|uniref:type III secretion system export apparatus subunit SctR n=1 Tax=Trinickia sp. TaxID=2571163 RepID=UPI002C39A0CD|nr:type III secretion system export apparatus subunit SctR [Trinickia sp.]HTI19194.1 type III secretion system export apparatus subunit SctR [Trinickia sp.]